MMRKRLLLAAMTLTVLLGATIAGAASLPPGGSFDDDDGNIHEPAIEAIAAAGITKGCNPADGNTKYCPNDPVTRGQMAAFLVRALALPPTQIAPFTDTAGVFEDSINRLAAAGITKGCNPADGNTKYCPNDPVKRDQMASFLTRALNLTPIVPPPPTTSPTTTTTTAPPTETFGDGTWIVGSDIPPGTYRTDSSPSTCYGERLSGFSGEFDDIIANELSDDPIIVTIEPTDAGFTSNRCGLWSTDLSPRTDSPTAGFDDGYWIVGTEIAPGLWRNSDSSGTCYWERLSGFSWELDDIIANGLSDSIQTVQIAATDAGFSSNRCGGWIYLGP